MDLKTHRLRRPSQERHEAQARGLAQQIPKKNEFSTAPVRAQ
jgi:hypothetical protein